MTPKERRDAATSLSSIRDTDERLVLATGRYIGEGFDDARLDTLFLAMPVSWKGTLIHLTYSCAYSHYLPMKTERLNLLISPEAKAEIAARASALNLSISELIRRAVASYEPAADDAALHALAGELLETVARTERALDAAVCRLERLEEKLERCGKEVRDEVRESAERWPFPAFPTDEGTS